MPKRAGAWVVHHLAQVVMVVLQGFLTHDDIPATGKRSQHESLRTGLLELELDGMGVTDVNRTHRRKQRRARDADALRRPDDAGVGGLHVLSGQLSTVV